MIAATSSECGFHKQVELNVRSPIDFADPKRIALLERERSDVGLRRAFLGRIAHENTTKIHFQFYVKV